MEKGEELPHITVEFSEDNHVEITPENAALYTFIGKTAIHGYIIEHSNFDHIFIDTSEDDEHQTGIYVFGKFTPGYRLLAQHMLNMGFPAMINMRTVPECDATAYMREVENQAQLFNTDMPDFLPDDFS